MAAHLLTGVVAVRVFAGDIRTVGKRPLSAGVRVGAAQHRCAERAIRRSGAGNERTGENR